MTVDEIQSIIEDIRRVAQLIGKDTLSRSEYFLHGQFSAYQIYDGGNTWGNLCERAGIKTKAKIVVSDEQYFSRLTKDIKILGRYPMTSERKKFSLNMSKNRYPTLDSFIQKAVELGKVDNLFKTSLYESQLIEVNSPLQSEIVDMVQYAMLESNQKNRLIPPIPIRTKRSKWERINLPGFPYAPQEEQGVLAIFAILCEKRILPWQILDMTAGQGIDAICFDEINKKEISVELKYLLSKHSWNHSIEDLDYVVCWKNRWSDFPKPVIELSKLIKEQETK